MQPQNQRFADSFLWSKRTELCAIVTKQAVLCSQPKRSGVVLDQTEDIEIAKALVLAVVKKAELLSK